MDDLIREYIQYSDGKLYWKKKPCRRAMVGSEITGSLLSNGYKRFLFQGKSYYIHRVVYFLNTGEWPNKIDHRNRNRLDNDFNNLRAVSDTENAQNKTSHRGSSSKYVGVAWAKLCNKYVAYIQVNKKRKHLGCFEDEEEAARVRDLASKLYFGNFANINLEES